MNILITGGAGFIPSSLAEQLLGTFNCKVVLLDNLLTGKKSHVPDHPACTFIECDVNNLEQLGVVFNQFRFDFVFHYAAVVGVKRTLDNPILVLEDIQGIKNVLDLSRDNQVQRVFYASSSEVYGEPVHLPQNEHTTPLNSRLPYAIVKNVGESYFRSYFQEYGLNYTIFRFFNTFGPKQSVDFVMSKFIEAALKNEPITIYGDGQQTRTFCYIDDNISACIAALKDNLYVNDVVNIGNDEITTIETLVSTILKVTNSKSEIVYLPPLPDGDMTRRQPDISKMRRLHPNTFVTLEEGIRRVIDFQVKQLV